MGYKPGISSICFFFYLIGESGNFILEYMLESFSFIISKSIEQNLEKGLSIRQDVGFCFLWQHSDWCQQYIKFMYRSD